MRSAAPISLLLVVATLAVFAPTLRYDFVGYDDYEYVLGNPHVTAPPSAASWADAFGARVHGNWHPLTLISLQLDHALWGRRAAGYHLTNLLLHELSVVLLFLALLRTTRAVGRSAFVAAVFGVHPLHVESVAWIAERKDVLAGLFFMLALLAYARYAERPRAGRYGVVMLCLALGLLSKPMLVTLPLLLLLLDWWPLGRLRPEGAPPGAVAWPRLRRALIEKLPLLLLAAAVSAVTLAGQQDAGGLRGDSLVLRLANAVHSYGAYAAKSLWPSRLAVFYPHPLATISWAEVALSGLALIAASSAAARLARTRPYVAVGWLWYLGMLVPVIGLVQVGLQARADRYTYLPQIGLAIAVAWGAVDLLAGRRGARAALAASGAAAVLALGVVAARQVTVWRDPIALFEHALRVTERNAIAHAVLSRVLLEQGRLEQADHHAREAVRFGPESFQAQYAMARVAERQGNLDELIRRYRILLEIAPDAAGAGVLHHELGFALLRARRYEEARPHLERVRAENPDWPHVRVGLALVEEGTGHAEAAVAHYREALAQHPDLRFAANNLARLLADCERLAACDPDEAVRLAEAAAQRRRRPDPVLLNTLAAAYRAAGRPGEAERAARRAARAARQRGGDPDASTYPLPALFRELGIAVVTPTR